MKLTKNIQQILLVTLSLFLTFNFSIDHLNPETEALYFYLLTKTKIDEVNSDERMRLFMWILIQV
ncbi:hypothetical protein NIES3974_41490 [Calothrix sp. NIES-3974]|nr:hypothetical protein NIES3974_41490 [Calothrix sp. NIES-3974]